MNRITSTNISNLYCEQQLWERKVFKKRAIVYIPLKSFRLSDLPFLED